MNERAGKGGTKKREKMVRHNAREGREKNKLLNETEEEEEEKKKKKKDACKEVEGGELQRQSLARAGLFNLSIPVAPLWLKIEIL